MIFEPKSIKVIGMGGIGSNLVNPLLRWVDSSIRVPVMFIDGDKIELKNLPRQSFYVNNIGQNKATALVNFYAGLFPELKISAGEFYLDAENVANVIQENDIILVGVDNYKTRIIIQKYILNLKNTFAIFMGNELTTGDVLLFLKKDGKSITKPIWTEHPELLKKIDKLPTELSCEQLALSEPQIIFTNLTAATIGLNALYKFSQGLIDVTESNFDINLLASASNNYAFLGEENAKRKN